MIQKGSFLNVIDNSGAKIVCSLHLPMGYRKRYAFLGDVIIVSVKKLRSKRKSLSKVKKGAVLKALIVRVVKSYCSHASERLSFFENSVVILGKNNKFLGTRIFGSIPYKFRHSRFLRIFSLSSGTVF